MTDATAGPAPRPPQGPMLAADGRPLKASLARALRAQKLRSLMLIAPLLIFVLVTFLFPIGDMLLRSVENQIVPNTLPRTVEALADWDPASGELAGRAGLRGAARRPRSSPSRHKTNTRLGSRLNYEYSGMSSLMRGVGRDVEKMDPAQPFKEQFIEADRQVGRPAVWQTIKLFSGPYTVGLPAERRRPAAHPGRHRAEAAGRAHLPQALPAHRGDEPRDHLRLLPARLPDRLPAGEPAAAHLEPAADPGAAAVLDLAARAHRLVEGAAAAAGRDQRRAGLGRRSSPTPTGW